MNAYMMKYAKRLKIQWKYHYKEISWL